MCADLIPASNVKSCLVDAMKYLNMPQTGPIPETLMMAPCHLGLSRLELK